MRLLSCGDLSCTLVRQTAGPQPLGTGIGPDLTFEVSKFCLLFFCIQFFKIFVWLALKTENSREIFFFYIVSQLKHILIYKIQ